MDITGYVEHVRADLLATAEAGDEPMVRSAERLVAALDAGLRMALLEALSDAAAEITTALDGPVVEVRLKGRVPQFVVTEDADRLPQPGPGADLVDADPDGTEDGDAPTARITLRLPDGLKVRAEEAAARSRQSLNTWLIAAVRSAAAGPPPPPSRDRGRVGKQLSGWAR